MFLLLCFSSPPNGPIVFLAVVGYPGQEEPFKVFFPPLLQDLRST